MSHCLVKTACVTGSEVLEVSVEVDIQPGLPLFTIIGLPDKRIDEAKERVRAAMKNSGLGFPLGKITINLAPSSVPKNGTGFDLAIALGILASQGGLEPPTAWVLGELGLNGEVRACTHLASILIAARERGVACIIPSAQQTILELVGAKQGAVVKNLSEVSKVKWQHWEQSQMTGTGKPAHYKLDAIQGQDQAKRALLIALAGEHHLLLTGPPGGGKTLLAEAALELLPPLNREELLELIQLYAYANHSWETTELTRPFRNPRHTTTQAGMFGGGNPLRPGEVTLAQEGILFLDELPLYSREVLEGFRDVLTNKRVIHNRLGRRQVFPAHFILIAARNLCACGRMGLEGEECQCSAAERLRYSLRISEPLLDRCALFCEVSRMRAEEWKSPALPKGAAFAAKIEQVRRERRQVTWSEESELVLYRAVEAFSLSGRGRESTRKVSETIARLEGVEKVAPVHVQEALQYRRKPLF